MSEVRKIEDQLRRALEGGAWHGPSLREALDGVDAGKAAARPIAGAHSIWELALHASAWEEVVRKRVTGEWVEEPEEGDWPAVGETSDAAWKDTLARLDERHGRLLAAVAGLAEFRLDEPAATGKSTVYVTLHGVIQHTLYHAGQIAVLKKA